MQNDLPEGDDHRIPQGGNRPGKLIKVNEVIPADPFLGTEEAFGRNELLKRDDQSAQRDIHVDEDDDQTMSKLTGHEISQDGEIIRKDSDVAPYVGFGRIITKVVGGVYKYKVEFLNKVKFKDALPDEKTKGESVEFTTTSLEGTVMKLNDGSWSKTKTFDTYNEAITYLEGLLAVPTP